MQLIDQSFNVLSVPLNNKELSALRMRLFLSLSTPFHQILNKSGYYSFFYLSKILYRIDIQQYESQLFNEILCRFNSIMTELKAKTERLNPIIILVI